MKNILKSTALAAVFGCLAPLGALFKVSFVVGSRCALFSFSQCLTPLAGAFGGIPVSILVGISQLLWYKSCAATNLLLICPIATLCGALYFALRPQKLLAALIPLSCVILFIAHPHGAQAAWYSFFWTVPLLTLLLPHQSFFLHALGSTFTTHAVGTVLWLYVKNLSPQLFVSLVPLVIVERLLFATGMTVSYYAIKHLTALVSPEIIANQGAEVEHA